MRSDNDEVESSTAGRRLAVDFRGSSNLARLREPEHLSILYELDSEIGLQRSARSVLSKPSAHACGSRGSLDLCRLDIFVPQVQEVLIKQGLGAFGIDIQVIDVVVCPPGQLHLA